MSPEQDEKDTDTLVDEEDYRASEKTGTAGDPGPPHAYKLSSLHKMGCVTGYLGSEE